MKLRARDWKEAALLLSCLASTSTIGACSGCSGNDAPPPASTQVDAPSEWAVHVLVRPDDGAERWVDLHAVREIAEGEPQDDLTSTAPALTAQAADGGFTVLPDDADIYASPSNRNGWVLLFGAASQCLNPRKQFASLKSVVVPPWSTTAASYIFPEAPKSCEEALLDEEALLCIADHLSEVADAVAPVTWSAVPAFDADLPAGTWVIPPQADKDTCTSSSTRTRTAPDMVPCSARWRSASRRRARRKK